MKSVTPLFVYAALKASDSKSKRETAVTVPICRKL